MATCPEEKKEIGAQMAFSSGKVNSFLLAFVPS
jgi:hypothetical protein